MITVPKFWGGIQQKVSLRISHAAFRFFDGEDDVDGIFSTDGTDTQLQRKESARKRLETEYKHLTSVTLLMAQEIQDGLDEVDYEEIKLEERGKQIEKAIESQAPGNEHNFSMQRSFPNLILICTIKT